MPASIEEPIPALAVRSFLVQLITGKELGLVESAIPLIVVSFRGLDPQGDVATWSVILDQDRASDLTSILAGVSRGGFLPRNKAASRRFRRRFCKPRSGRLI